MGCVREIFGLVGHPLSAIFQHAQLVATLVERLARLLHLGRHAASLVGQVLQVSCRPWDVASDAPTGFARWLPNWNAKRHRNEKRFWKRDNEDDISIGDVQSSSRSSGRTPPPKRPLKNPSLGGSGISHGMNSSPIKSPRVDLKPSNWHVHFELQQMTSEFM